MIRAGFATAIAAFGPFLVDESGEAGEEAAIPLAETGAEGGLASILEQRFATSPQDVTIPGSKLPNFSIDVNATDFVNQLIADGFSMYNDAATQIYTNGLETYSLYFRNSGVWGGLYNGIAGRFKFVLSGP